jgi:hypothetical protein
MVMEGSESVQRPVRNRIRKAQNIMDPTDSDPDPEHWYICTQDKRTEIKM